MSFVPNVHCALVDIYLSALHDHNYRLPKLIISSRLMCWRLFVIFFPCFIFYLFLFFLWSKSTIVVCIGNTRKITYLFEKIDKKKANWNQKGTKQFVAALKNEWIFENWHTKCTLYTLFHCILDIQVRADRWWKRYPKKIKSYSHKINKFSD